MRFSVVLDKDNIFRFRAGTAEQGKRWMKTFKLLRIMAAKKEGMQTLGKGPGWGWGWG